MEITHTYKVGQSLGGSCNIWLRWPAAYVDPTCLCCLFWCSVLQRPNCWAGGDRSGGGCLCRGCWLVGWLVGWSTIQNNCRMCALAQLPNITHSARVTPNCSWGPPHACALLGTHSGAYVHHTLRQSMYGRSDLPDSCVLCCCIRESTLALHATFCMCYVVAGMLSASLVQLCLSTHTLTMLRQPNPTQPSRRIVLLHALRFVSRITAFRNICRACGWGGGLVGCSCRSIP
jgi:hypothetical protein